MSTTTTLARAAAAVATALVLVGCSSSPADNEHSNHDDAGASPTTDSSASFNEADVMFAQMMIPHHQQAVEMSELVLANPDTGPEVLALAQQIRDAQAPEIELMTGWLEDWGAEATAMDHGDHGGMEGMLSDDEIAELAAASGSDVDRLFLAGMIAHHEGAIAMAQDEIDTGANPEAIALAEQIVTAQQEEITAMEGHLDGNG